MNQVCKVRLSKDKYFIGLAHLVAKRSTCVRREVGCVVVDENYRIMSTGHNGVPPKIEHCTDVPCKGATCPSGTGLDLCRATHAEINALLFCGDITKVARVYTTLMPCIQCVKAILTSACVEIIYDTGYNIANDEEILALCSYKEVILRHFQS